MKHDCFRPWLAMLILASCTVATAGEVEAGQLIPSPAGPLPAGTVVKSAAVSVHGTTASLQYDLENSSSRTAEGRFTLYSPLFGWAGHDTSYPDKSLAELQIQSGSENIRIQTRSEAFHQGVRVTETLTRAGLDPLQVSLGDKAPIQYRASHARQYRKAIQSGLLTLDEGFLYPNWQVLTSRSWALPLEAKASTSMTVKYALQPAYEPFGINDAALDGLLRVHCSSIGEMLATFKATNTLWPAQGVVQQYEISVGLDSSAMPSSFDLDFSQDQLWAGLTPRFSVTCQGNGTSIIGTPSIKQTITRTSNRPLSILVFFPQ